MSTVHDLLEQCKYAIESRIIEKGFEPGTYQGVWTGIVRLAPPAENLQSCTQWVMNSDRKAVDEFDEDDCLLAVLDALCNLGCIPATPGSGTESVVKMIELAYQDRDYWRARSMAAEKYANELMDELYSDGPG